MSPKPAKTMKALIRTRANDRCEGFRPTFATARRSSLDPKDHRCNNREHSMPECIVCDGTGQLPVPKGTPGGVRLFTASSGYKERGQQHYILCTKCRGRGALSGGPPITLVFHRLRGVVGQNDPNDVMLLCPACAEFLKSKPDLAATLQVVTTRMK